MSHSRERSERASAWLSAERARQNVRALGAVLAPHGMELLLLKGVYIAHCVAPEPWSRPMSDADVLLVRGDFRSALDLIRKAPHWSEAGTAVGAVLLNYAPPGRSRAPQDVDFHESALHPYFGRVSTEILRRRARPASLELFGPGIFEPDPVDAAAIAVAKGVEDTTILGGEWVPTDLEELETHRGVSPLALAERLKELGLRRIGLIAFHRLATKDPKWRRHLVAFRPTRGELAVVAVMSMMLGRKPASHREWALVRLCTDHPLDGVLGAIERIWHAARRRLTSVA